EQAQLVVAHRVRELVGGEGGHVECSRFELPAAAFAPELVDGPVASGPEDPRARVVGDAALRPRAQCRDERASCTASAASQTSPIARASEASTAPDSARNTASTSRAVLARSVLIPGQGSATARRLRPG